MKTNITLSNNWLKGVLLYHSRGNVVWSLFRTQSDGVTIYYHETDEFYIISGDKAKYYSLTEVADRWDPVEEKVQERV